MKTKEYDIEGMSCGHCIAAIKKELAKLPIEYADVKVGYAKIIFDELVVEESAIENAIIEAGFKIRN